MGSTSIIEGPRGVVLWIVEFFNQGVLSKDVADHLSVIVDPLDPGDKMTTISL